MGCLREACVRYCNCMVQATEAALLRSPLQPAVAGKAAFAESFFPEFWRIPAFRLPAWCWKITKSLLMQVGPETLAYPWRELEGKPGVRIALEFLVGFSFPGLSAPIYPLHIIKVAKSFITKAAG